MPMTTRAQARLFETMPPIEQDPGYDPGNETVKTEAGQRKRKRSHHGDHQGRANPAQTIKCHGSSTKLSSPSSAPTPHGPRPDALHPLLESVRGGPDGDQGSSEAPTLPTKLAVSAGRPVTTHGHGVDEDADERSPGVGRFLASGVSASSPGNTAHEQEQTRKRELRTASLSRLSPRRGLEEDSEWRPTAVIGQPLGGNLSTMEEAERMARSLQEVYEQTKLQQTSAKGLRGVVQELEKVTKWRDRLKAERTQEDMAP